MEDAKIEGQEILSKFLCPFNCDSTLPNNGCPFGHRPPPESKQFEHLLLQDASFKCPLKPLPPYCCASYLALKCSKREYSFQCGAHSSAEILTRCEDGFHMELGEVDDFEMFAQKMAKILLEASEFCKSDFKSLDGSLPVCNPIEVLKPLPSNYLPTGQKRPRHVLVEDDNDEDDVDRSCAICFDPLSNNRSLFGLLENCAHVFCATCIHKWQIQGTNEDCPVCRKRITKILVWPKLLQTQVKKQPLFDLICGEVPTDEQVDRAIDSGTPTFFRSEGKIMRAHRMNLESMRVFLKKPKPNWKCYVMIDMAFEGNFRMVMAPNGRLRVTNEPTTNQEVATGNVTVNRNQNRRTITTRSNNSRISNQNDTNPANNVVSNLVNSRTMVLRSRSIPINIATNNIEPTANNHQTTESNISRELNPINNINNITANNAAADRLTRLVASFNESANNTINLLRNRQSSD